MDFDGVNNLLVRVPRTKAGELKLNIKHSIFVILFLIISQLLIAQKVAKGYKGNIEISDSLTAKIIASFRSYLKEEYKTFNYSDYFIGVTILKSNDSIQIELTISNYAMARSRVKELPGYYGYLKSGKIYFIFWNNNPLIQRSNKPVNPNVFSKYKLPKIKAPYDPYSWQITLHKNCIISIWPKETIQKYLLNPMAH